MVHLSPCTRLEREFGKLTVCQGGPHVIASIPRARASRVTVAQPEVFYTAAKLDEGVKVLIVDHPAELHIVFDENLNAAELAAALTEAVRDNLSKKHWSRILALLANDND